MGKAAALKADGPHVSAVSGIEAPHLLHRLHRKSAGAVQRRCLESRWSVMNRHPGSNPGSSASFHRMRAREAQARCLLSSWFRKGPQGSNPCLSAFLTKDRLLVNSVPGSPVICLAR